MPKSELPLEGGQDNASPATVRVDLNPWEAVTITCFLESIEGEAMQSGKPLRSFYEQMCTLTGMPPKPAEKGKRA